jgi:hypothetical protein
MGRGRDGRMRQGKKTSTCCYIENCRTEIVRENPPNQQATGQNNKGDLIAGPSKFRGPKRSAHGRIRRIMARKPCLLVQRSGCNRLLYSR